MSVGLPTSTPAFQLAAMYGVKPDIPGFHYHDKRQGTDIYFPRAGDAARVEAEQARGRRGILDGGSAYGCVFTGGAPNNLFNFAVIKRPTGRGVLRAMSAFVVLGWVTIKAGTLTTLAVGRALLRFIADPVREAARGWKWLAIKIAVSVWMRELFTLAVSRDLYGGVPAIYVNYLDYDILAHAYGPEHIRALRALRTVDRSIRRLWRVARRVPEHRYDVYILSDHGQTATKSYPDLVGGRRLESLFFGEYLKPDGVTPVTRTHPVGRNIAAGIKAYRGGAPGLLQRFVNYLEHDFLARIGETPEAREHGGVRVVAAGPNAFVYFLDEAVPLTLERIERRFPGLVDEIAQSRGIGFVLVRSPAGPVYVAQGKRYVVQDGDAGPFAGRPDRALVLDGIRELMAMPSAGDLVIYGHGSPDGNISFIPEAGAHAGPSPEEMQTFIVCPPRVELPASITHPVQLYAHFVAYADA
jgi:hypothetical protein